MNKKEVINYFKENHNARETSLFNDVILSFPEPVNFAINDNYYTNIYEIICKENKMFLMDLIDGETFIDSVWNYEDIEEF